MRRGPFDMAPTLLVLAAGLGSRYGGLKQIDPVGPAGETILDYAVFDAWRAGFRRVVFVIREEFAEVFRAKIGARYAGRLEVAYVFQSLADLPPGFSPPPGRERPWGTGHAVWCARAVLDGPFAVINADDFYGADSFVRLAAFLAGARGAEASFAMVGFRLAHTLSEHGAVSRGLCRAQADRLESIEELTGLTGDAVGPGRRFTGAELVSMNCWGFTPALFPGLAAELEAFMRARGGEPRSEVYLPAAVSALIARGEAAVRVLPTESGWFGVTYREDRPRVQTALAGLVAAGAYPAGLFAS